MTSSAGSSYAGAGCALCTNVQTADGTKFWTSKSFTLDLGTGKTATVNFDGTYTNEDEVMEAVIYDGKIEVQKWWDYSEKQEQDIEDIISVKYTNIQVVYETTAASTTSLRGDINRDGVFNVSDVVLMQKWLLAVPNTKMADWKAGDLCEDNRLDVFDLCLMKRELINGTAK